MGLQNDRGHFAEGFKYQGEAFECSLISNEEPLMVFVALWRS